MVECSRGNFALTIAATTYHSMTDADLKVIYAYLTAIPTAEPCNTVADGCPVGTNPYTYKATSDCPNPAPPQ